MLAQPELSEHIYWKPTPGKHRLSCCHLPRSTRPSLGEQRARRCIQIRGSVWGWELLLISAYFQSAHIPTAQPEERRLWLSAASHRCHSPPDPQRSVPVGAAAAAARTRAGPAGPHRCTAAEAAVRWVGGRSLLAAPSRPTRPAGRCADRSQSTGPGTGPARRAGRGWGLRCRHPLSTWACGRTAAPRGRDSPEAAGAERGSRTLGSQRDSAPGGGGGGRGEGWGGGGPALTREPGNAHCACAPPAGHPRGLRVRGAAGAGEAGARREDALRLRGRREECWVCPRLTQRRRLGGRRMRREGLAHPRGAGWGKYGGALSVGELVAVRGGAMGLGVPQGQEVGVSAWEVTGAAAERPERGRAVLALGGAQLGAVRQALPVGWAEGPCWAALSAVPFPHAARCAGSRALLLIPVRCSLGSRALAPVTPTL